jgi:hypothetical protein
MVRERDMSIEKWAEDGRLAGVCDRCSLRTRLDDRDVRAAMVTLLGAGWAEGKRTVNGRELRCPRCMPLRGTRGLRAPGAPPPTFTTGTIVAGKDGRYTLSFQDALGRKRVLLWKAPLPQKAAAERAMATGEEVTVRVEGAVRVGVRGGRAQGTASAGRT